MAEVIDITELIKARKEKEANKLPSLDWTIHDEDYFTASSMSTDALADELLSALSSDNGKGMLGLSVGTLVAELVNRLDGMTVILEEAISRYNQEHN